MLRVEVSEEGQAALPAVDVDDAVVVIGSGTAARIRLPAGAVESEHVTEVFTGFGEKGVRAETVATKAAEEARDYLAAGVPVGEHLADQLLLPIALAGRGAFRTVRPSSHTTTHLQLLRDLLGIRATVEQVSEQAWHIEVER